MGVELGRLGHRRGIGLPTSEDPTARRAQQWQAISHEIAGSPASSSTWRASA